MNEFSNIRLAILGGKPAFSHTIPVGQLNFPDWDKFEAAFRDIFSRQYYTNQGPLVEQLEERLQQFLGVKHVICMTNATIALMIAAKALSLTGKVICPAYTFIATAQSLSWAGLEPVFCDVDLISHQMSVEKAASLIDEDVSAILGVHLWGNSCKPRQFEELADRKNIKIYFDAAQAFGCRFGETYVSQFGELEVFSFHATKILSATEGGCVCTNNDYLASRLRNVRSSYGAREPVDVPLTGNGRMSEAQAAMALLSLEDYPAMQTRNQRFFELYKELLSSIPGLYVVGPDDGDISNYQYIVVEVSSKEFGLTRNELVEVLKAENVSSRKYFSPGVHRSIPYAEIYPKYLNALPVTDYLCERVMQLPSGSDVTEEKIGIICHIIKSAQEQAHLLKQELASS